MWPSYGSRRTYSHGQWITRWFISVLAEKPTTRDCPSIQTCLCGSGTEFTEDCTGQAVLRAFFLSFFLIHYYFLIAISPIQFFFLPYSMVTQSHIHVHILFSHIIMLHHKWLDIVPSATEQELIANPFQRQWFVSINPKLLFVQLQCPCLSSAVIWMKLSHFSFSIRRTLAGTLEKTEKLLSPHSNLWANIPTLSLLLK